MSKLLKLLLLFITVIFAGIGIAVTVVFFGMQHGLLNVRGSIMERNASFGPVPTINAPSSTTTEPITNGCTRDHDQTKPCEWNETVQWAVVKGGLLKDAAIIERVSKETGISERMIAAAVIPEQTRFFY